jgi:hypothetical protein
MPGVRLFTCAHSLFLICPAVVTVLFGFMFSFFHTYLFFMCMCVFFFLFFFFLTKPSHAKHNPCTQTKLCWTQTQNKLTGLQKELSRLPAMVAQLESRLKTMSSEKSTLEAQLRSAAIREQELRMNLDEVEDFHQSAPSVPPSPRRPIRTSSSSSNKSNSSLSNDHTSTSMLPPPPFPPKRSSSNQSSRSEKDSLKNDPLSSLMLPAYGSGSSSNGGGGGGIHRVNSNSSVNSMNSHNTVDDSPRRRSSIVSRYEVEASPSALEINVKFIDINALFMLQNGNSDNNNKKIRNLVELRSKLSLRVGPDFPVSWLFSEALRYAHEEGHEVVKLVQVKGNSSFELELSDEVGDVLR